MNPFSEKTAEKALRLVDENRVILMPIANTTWWRPQDEAFVAGQTSSHHVIADFEGVRCSCKAWRINRPCSHQLAAMIVWASEAAAALQDGAPESGGMAVDTAASPARRRAHPPPQPRWVHTHNHGDAA